MKTSKIMQEESYEIPKEEVYEIPMEIRDKFHDVINKVNVVTLQVHKLEVATVKLDAAREATAIEISVIKNDNHHMVRLIESMDGLFRDLVKEVKEGFKLTTDKIEKLQNSNNTMKGAVSVIKPVAMTIITALIGGLIGGIITYCFKFLGN